MKNFEKLEVGATYRNARGDVRTITYFDINATEEAAGVYLDDGGRWYLSDGRVNVHYAYPDYNLVEKLGMSRLTEEQLQALEAEGFTRNEGRTPDGVMRETCVTVVYFDGMHVTDDNYADARYWTIDGTENDPFDTGIAVFRVEKPSRCCG